MRLLMLAPRLPLTPTRQCSSEGGAHTHTRMALRTEAVGNYGAMKVQLDRQNKTGIAQDDQASENTTAPRIYVFLCFQYKRRCRHDIGRKRKRRGCEEDIAALIRTTNTYSGVFNITYVMSFACNEYTKATVRHHTADWHHTRLHDAAHPCCD